MSTLKAMMAAAVAAAVLAAFAAPAKKPAKGGAAKGGDDSGRAAEFRGGTITKNTAAAFKPERTTPVQTGEFQVDLVVITFPDCVPPPSTEAVRASLGSLGGSTTIADYYKDYSQDITWPVLDVYPTVYTAPQPFGYYCRWDLMKT